MDLKEVIASVVYQSSEGLALVQIVEALAQVGIHTSARQVVEIVDRNPRLFSQIEGRICVPEGARKKTEHMDLKDMVATVVCQKPEGLVPLQIAEDLSRQFGVQASTRQIIQVVSRHPKLFAEVDGRITSRYDNSLL
jgi:hypothetical protein